MKVSLSDFSYYFNLTGTSGGLYSMEMKFKPRLEGERKVADDLKAAARYCVDVYTSVIDPLYVDLIDGKKEPLLIDTPYSISSGYRYDGRFTDKGRKILERRLHETFGEEPLDARGEIGPYDGQQVTVQCSFRKSGQGFDDLTVDVKFNMSHMLNVCFFRFTKRMEGIEIENAALAHMNQLEQMLNATLGRDDMDYYDALTLTDGLGRGSGK